MSLLHVLLLVAIVLILFGGVSHYGAWGGVHPAWTLGGSGIGVVLLVIVLILLIR